MQLYVGSVPYIISLLFAPICYFLITRLTFINILFMFVFSFVFLFSILGIPCFCAALCIVSPFVLSLSYFVQVYRPLPPGGNQTAVNKYRIINERHIDRSIDR